MAKKMKFDLVEIADLGGEIVGAAMVISQMTDKPFPIGVVGDTELSVAALKFSKSWNFRRKYFVKDLNGLSEAADEFVKDVVRSDRAAADFMRVVKRTAVDSMGAK